MTIIPAPDPVAEPAWRDTPGVWIERVGRVGLAAYGVVHLVLACLAVKIATIGGRAHVDPRGAVATIASGGWVGQAMLAGGAASLTVFAVWQVRASIVGFRWVPETQLRFRKRVGAAAKAAGVSSVAWLALGFLIRDPQDRRGVRTLVAELFAVPGGRLIVLAAGAVVLGTAIATAVTGVRGTFVGDLVPGALPPRVLVTARWLGTVGNLTRAVGFGVIGTLAVLAVLRNAPDQVGGLDRALRTLADQTLGLVVLGITGVGFAAYGLYCLLDAWARHP